MLHTALSGKKLDFVTKFNTFVYSVGGKIIRKCKSAPKLLQRGTGTLFNKKIKLIWSYLNMDIALTTQLFQHFSAQPSNQSMATIADDIRSLLGLASGALMAAGEALKQAKDNLSRARFGDWLNENGFVSADVNKLIKLFEYFGDAFDDLTTVNPLSLMRLLAPSGETARNALFNTVQQNQQTGEVVTSQSVEDIRKLHSPQPKPRAPKKQHAPNENDSIIKMVGNQPGGTGIFRLEVKNHELANQLDTEWKESGCSADKWMQFMSASTHKIQEIAQVVLGRKIADVSELSELNILIGKSQTQLSDNKFVDVELEIDDLVQVLPSQIVDCLNKLRDLDESIVRYSNPIARRMHREERTGVLAQLKMLAAEYQLDVESLLGRQYQELARC
ncbi:hypothetical protein NIES4071_24010 [Calothrix sp. NIES-4071]|nr:hypothetical protein NIES4071_24010 [Calothrix sp. NIES-4071]BAZ56724.1 hypothetical protein NIES4105_23950 [Calothrix sp. NIES-4105]